MPVKEGPWTITWAYFVIGPSYGLRTCNNEKGKVLSSSFVYCQSMTVILHSQNRVFDVPPLTNPFTFGASTGYFTFGPSTVFKSGFGTHVAVDLCQVAFFFPFTHSFPPHRRIPTSSCVRIIFPLHHGVTRPPPPPLLVPPPTRRHPHRLPPPVRCDRRRLTEVPKSSWTRARTRPL